jgi:hypothetical protein
MKQLSAGVDSRKLRTRIETGQTELVLVPRDGSEPLWLTRMDGEGADSSIEARACGIGIVSFGGHDYSSHMPSMETKRVSACTV